jgi:glycosyltransferase involved in cell wall biosynthesis
MKLIYLSPIEWNYIKQRPQFLCEGFSQYFEVVYIEPSWSILKSLLHRNLKFIKKKYRINNATMVFRPSGIIRMPKKISNDFLYEIGNKIEQRQLKKLLDENSILIVGNPLYYDIIKYFDLKNFIIIYDCMDDFIELYRLLGYNNKFIQRLENCERNLCKISKNIVVTSDVLLKRIKEKYGIDEKNIIKISNGINNIHKLNFKLLNEANFYNQQLNFLYVGTVSEWFDLDAITKIAQEFSESKIIIAGPIEKKIKKDILNIPNIQYRGIISHNECMKLIQKSDICLYPFKKSYLLDTINPVKILEYMMFRKPIIAVESIELAKYNDIIYMYNDISQLTDKINEIIQDVKNGTFCNKNFLIDEIITNNTWDKKINHFLSTFK